MLSHLNQSIRRELGAYYTPVELSSILANYLVRTGSDTLLEPSFGGVNLLSEAVQSLHAKGCLDPFTKVYGCDLDPHAFNSLTELQNKYGVTDQSRFILKDFLETKKEDFGIDGFDTVLANPPFIGYGQMSDRQRKICRSLLGHFSISKARYAGTWFYFLLKCLSMLNLGGRICFVLPHAFMDSEYAEPVRNLISSRFQKSTVFAFSQRFFEDQGTKARIMILVAEGWQERPQSEKSMTATYVSGLEDFSKKLNNFSSIGRQKHCLSTTIGKVDGKISNAEVSFLNTLKNHPLAMELGDLVKVRIGLVAGDAAFFTFNRSECKSLNFKIGRHVQPVLRSLRNIPGLEVDMSEIDKCADIGKSTYLLRYSKALLNSPAYCSYIQGYDEYERERNETFKTRKVWHEVDDGQIPEFFIPCMNMLGPRLVFNKARVNCLNNTHRGYFSTKINVTQRMLISISVLTSFTQTVAELESKQYGSKTLKMEPSLYKKLPILIPDSTNYNEVRRVYKKINNHLVQKDWQSATRLASEYVYGKLFESENAQSLVQTGDSLKAKLMLYRA